MGRSVRAMALGTTRASPEEKPRDSPAPAGSLTHSLPRTPRRDITGFCPKNSEAPNVTPAVGITYIRASHGLSPLPTLWNDFRIFRILRRITDQRGRVLCRGRLSTGAQAAECLRHANQARDPETRRQYEDLGRANGNSWPSELKNSNGKGRLSHLATSKSASAAVCGRRGHSSLASQHLRQIEADHVAAVGQSACRVLGNAASGQYTGL